MKGASVEVIGLEDMERTLKTLLPKHATNIMRATVHGIASEVAKDARKRAPKRATKDGGTLRKAIKAKRRRMKNGNPRRDVIITQGRDAKHDAYYWRLVEHGTVNQSERPFIRPAVDAARANLDEIITRQFGKKLEAAARREAKKQAKR